MGLCENGIIYLFALALEQKILSLLLCSQIFQILCKRTASDTDIMYNYKYFGEKCGRYYKKKQ